MCTVDNREVLYRAVMKFGASYTYYLCLTRDFSLRIITLYCLSLIYYYYV